MNRCRNRMEPTFMLCTFVCFSIMLNDSMYNCAISATAQLFYRSLLLLITVRPPDTPVSLI